MIFKATYYRNSCFWHIPGLGVFISRPPCLTYSHLWAGVGEEFGLRKRRLCPLYPSQHGLFVVSCERSVLLVVSSFSEFTRLHVVAALVYMGGRLSQWPPLLPSSLSILSSVLTNLLLEFSIEKNWTFIAHQAFLIDKMAASSYKSVFLSTTNYVNCCYVMYCISKACKIFLSIIAL